MNYTYFFHSWHTLCSYMNAKMMKPGCYSISFTTKFQLKRRQENEQV